MFKKAVFFGLFVCCISVFAEEEVTIKASGDFAKELKELVEKYQNSDINGSIEIVEKSDNSDEEAILSPIEQAMQDEIKAANKTQKTDRDVYDEYYSAEKQKSDFGFSLSNLFSDKQARSANADEGKEVYTRTCAQCHGENAEKSAYAAARVLTTLPKDELLHQLKMYKSDTGYGGSSGLVMRTQASAINQRVMESVIEYIETLKTKAADEKQN